MPTSKPGPGQLIAGAGGALLIVSLFLPWAEIGDVSGSGWELWTMADVFLLITAVFALGAALTGGRFGVFRPDMSLNAAADLLGVVSTIMLIWLIAFDFPEGAGREIGVFLALFATLVIAGGSGDYNVVRGGALFPSTAADDVQRVK